MRSAAKVWLALGGAVGAALYVIASLLAITLTATAPTTEAASDTSGGRPDPSDSAVRPVILSGSAPPLAVIGSPQPSPSATVSATASPSGAPSGPSRAAVPSCAQERPSGWLAAENARPGTAFPSGVRDGALPASGVLGYPNVTDTTCGVGVALHLGVLPGRPRRDVVVAAYRVGWYGGSGQRLVWRSARVPVFARPVPSGARYPHQVQPDWPESVTVTPDPSWPAGLYELVPLDAGSGAPAGPPIPLVVGDPASRAPALFLASSLTWNAYGDFGGWSLYRGPKGARAGAAARARVVAVRRPLTGSGLNQFLSMDAAAVRTVERAGAEATGTALDVDYASDVAVDADPARLARHAEIVVGGHSEYWTTRMYDGLVNALGAGTNAAFLGANNLWWRTRLERDADGVALREVVYRDAAEDPDTAEPTVKWDAATPARDPAAVLGQSHAAIGVRGGMQLLDAPDWFLRGTSLTPGAVLPGIVGNEADGYNGKGDNPHRTHVFGAGLLRGAGGPVLATISWTVHPSGAATFAAGTTQWACHPTGACRDRAVPADVATAVSTMTRNVVRALATPRAGLAHPVQVRKDWTFDPRTPFPAAAIGSYGTGATEEDRDD